MSPEAQRIAIGRICGWELLRWKDRRGNNCSGWRNPQGRQCSLLPEYTADLNAMHEAEKAIITKSQQDTFIETLWVATCAGFYAANIPKDSQEWILTHSTAAQRAEALLKTLGKWSAALSTKEEPARPSPPAP